MIVAASRRAGFSKGLLSSSLEEGRSLTLIALLIGLTTWTWSARAVRVVSLGKVTVGVAPRDIRLMLLPNRRLPRLRPRCLHL